MKDIEKVIRGEMSIGTYLARKIRAQKFIHQVKRRGRNPEMNEART